MLQENLIRMYEESFRTHRELPALTDYFKGEIFSYYEMAKEIAKLHLFFKKAEIRRGDKIALVGRNNPRWCITYLATITYGAVIVPILQDFAPADIVHIVNHSESRLLFVGDNYWDIIEEDEIARIDAVLSLTDFHVIYERLRQIARRLHARHGEKLPRQIQTGVLGRRHQISRHPQRPDGAAELHLRYDGLLQGGHADGE